MTKLVRQNATRARHPAASAGSRFIPVCGGSFPYGGWGPAPPPWRECAFGGLVHTSKFLFRNSALMAWRHFVRKHNIVYLRILASPLRSPASRSGRASAWSALCRLRRRTYHTATSHVWAWVRSRRWRFSNQRWHPVMNTVTERGRGSGPRGGCPRGGWVSEAGRPSNLRVTGPGKCLLAFSLEY